MLRTAAGQAIDTPRWAGHDQDSMSDRSSSRLNRRGVSRVEVLVLCGLAGIVLLITIPTVLLIRQEQQAQAFKDRLRQVGVGFSTFYDAHQKLPSDTRGKPPGR
jgi:hypothetical protein